MTVRAQGLDPARLEAFWASGFRRFRHVNIISSHRVEDLGFRVSVLWAVVCMDVYINTYTHVYWVHVDVYECVYAMSMSAYAC